MHMTELNKTAQQGWPCVVITGATQGVGRALADEFARDGHALLLVARDEAGLAAAAAELASAHGVTVNFAACDLSTDEGCAGVERALQRFSLYADILVNNAAMMAAGFFQDQEPAMLRKMADLNMRAMVDLTRRFLPGMIGRGTGGVLCRHQGLRALVQPRARLRDHVHRRARLHTGAGDGGDHPA